MRCKQQVHGRRPRRPEITKVCSVVKEFCEAESCSSYTHCMGCLADPYCGWCPSDDQDGGTCMEGGGGGPTDGTCDSKYGMACLVERFDDLTPKIYVNGVACIKEKRLGPELIECDVPQGVGATNYVQRLTIWSLNCNLFAWVRIDWADDLSLLLRFRQAKFFRNRSPDATYRR